MNSLKLMTEREVYEVYGLSIPWQRRRRVERRGPRFIKLGRLVRYRRADLEAFFTSQTIETSNQSEETCQCAPVL